MGLYEDMLAKQKRTEEFIKARDMTQSQVVEKLLKAEPELKSKGYTVNLSTYLRENKINPKEIKDTSWIRPVKKHEERAASRARTIAIQNKTPQISSESRSGARGAGTTYPNYIKEQEEIIETQKVIQENITREISDVIEGRVIRPTLNEPRQEIIYTQIPEQTPEKNNEKLLIIGGLALAILGFFIIRRIKK